MDDMDLCCREPHFILLFLNVKNFSHVEINDLLIIISCKIITLEILLRYFI